MTIAQRMKRWYLRVVPLRLFSYALTTGFEFGVQIFELPSAIFVPKAIRQREAVNFAYQRQGTFIILDRHQRVGFVRLLVQRVGRREEWYMDIYHGVHFTGMWKKVPKLLKGSRVRITAQNTPQGKGKTTRFESYIQVEELQ